MADLLGIRWAGAGLCVQCQLSGDCDRPRLGAAANGARGPGGAPVADGVSVGLATPAAHGAAVRWALMLQILVIMGLSGGHDADPG